ncbi:hypothetical protein G195_011194, partial [Phytophthora kernoviae 00238/432]
MSAPSIPSSNDLPVSLETLLVDFFTEVDKKRLNMAKVYGKRYAGREKWLFAELTKRYGASKTDGQMNQSPFAPPRGFEKNSHTAPAGLRQRRNLSGPGVPNQQGPGANSPPVTLEELLKELYKKHQPDKLKNVQIVAKQYAGKERELVGLLKGKYGALSVKHLEENLEALERAHRARTAGKGAAKKRGCFVRTISLVFWLSVLLFFAFGAVFVSFVVLDAQECRALANDEEELESFEDCVPLRKELETFTYERVGDYVRQSHHEACFCLEWMERESAVLSNLSGSELIELARLVPFSPDSFGDPWIASVKEQVPSQEFYDMYAKPVVDLSLDAGAFVWLSVLELTGFEDVPEMQAQTVSGVLESNELDVISLMEDESSMPSEEFEQASDEVENDSFSMKVKSDEHAVEVDVETEAFETMITDADVGVSEEISDVDVNDNILGEVRELEELEPSEDNDVTVEHVDPANEEVVISEEEERSPSSMEESEEHDLLDNAIAELKFADDSGDLVIEEFESVSENTEDELTARSEVDVEEVPSESFSVADLNEEAEFVGYGIEELATETPVETGTTETEVEIAPSEDDSVDDSVEVFGSTAGEEEVASATSTEVDGEESEDVVEVEVHQEGLDMTYPQSDSESTAVEQDIDSPEEVSRDVDDKSELVESDDESEDAEVLAKEVEEPLEEFNEAKLDTTVEVEVEAEEMAVTEDALEEAVEEEAVVDDDDVEVDMLGEGELEPVAKSVDELEDGIAVDANEHETGDIVSEESVAEDISMGELNAEMELEEEEAEEVASVESAGSSSEVVSVTSSEESVDNEEAKKSALSDAEVEGLELEQAPEDETTEGTVESESEMASFDKNDLEVSLRADEVTVANDDDDEDEPEEVDSGAADEKNDMSDEIVADVLPAESEPVASDVEDDSVVSGDDSVEVVPSEEGVDTEESAAELFEDVVSVVNDDGEDSDDDIPAETAVEKTESDEVPANVLEESANAINYDGVEGQPLSDDNVEAEVEAESGMEVHLKEGVESEEDPVIALDEDSVAIEATEVPDDTIVIEFGEDRKEELDGSTVEESVDASVKVEASVADV